MVEESGYNPAGIIEEAISAQWRFRDMALRKVRSGSDNSDNRGSISTVTPGDAFVLRAAAAAPAYLFKHVARLRKYAPLRRYLSSSPPVPPLRPPPESNDTDPEFLCLFVKALHGAHLDLVCRTLAALASEFGGAGPDTLFADRVLAHISRWRRPSDVLTVLRAVPTVALDAGGAAVFSAAMAIIRNGGHDTTTILPNLRELFALADEPGRYGQRRGQWTWSAASRCPHVAAFVLCQLQTSRPSRPDLFRAAMLHEESGSDGEGRGGGRDILPYLGLGRALGCRGNRNLVAIFVRHIVAGRAQAAGLYVWLRDRVSSSSSSSAGDAGVDWFVCEVILSLLHRTGPGAVIIQFLRELTGTAGYSFAAAPPPGSLRYDRGGGMAPVPCATWGQFFAAVGSLEILRVAHQECDVDLTGGGAFLDGGHEVPALAPAVLEYIQTEGQWGGGSAAAFSIKPALRRTTSAVTLS